MRKFISLFLLLLSFSISAQNSDKFTVMFVPKELHVPSLILHDDTEMYKYQNTLKDNMFLSIKTKLNNYFSENGTFNLKDVEGVLGQVRKGVVNNSVEETNMIAKVDNIWDKARLITNLDVIILLSYHVNEKKGDITIQCEVRCPYGVLDVNVVNQGMSYYYLIDSKLELFGINTNKKLSEKKKKKYLSALKDDINIFIISLKKDLENQSFPGENYQNWKDIRVTYKDIVGVNPNGDCVGDCMNGTGTLVYNTTNKKSIWGKEKKTRDGKSLWLDGEWIGSYNMTQKRESYEGEWKDGKRHGNGIYTYLDGSYYEGEWVDDKMHGKGEYNDFMNDRYRKWGHYYGFKYGGIGISNYSSWLHVDQYREVVKEYSVNKDMNKVKPISNKTETITSKMENRDDVDESTLTEKIVEDWSSYHCVLTMLNKYNGSVGYSGDIEYIKITINNRDAYFTPDGKVQLEDLKDNTKNLHGIYDCDEYELVDFGDNSSFTFGNTNIYIQEVVKENIASNGIFNLFMEEILSLPDETKRIEEMRDKGVCVLCEGTGECKCTKKQFTEGEEGPYEINIGYLVCFFCSGDGINNGYYCEECKRGWVKCNCLKHTNSLGTCSNCSGTGKFNYTGKDWYGN